jgi:hypothetical protein
MTTDNDMNQEFVPRNPAGYPEEETLDIKQLLYGLLPTGTGMP